MMGDDDKPFACSAPGCSQRFTNEDHLTVHKQKHEMTLKFGPPKLGDVLPVADQTPTPTRFLKNCEEVGLFNELPNVNPFEQEFKKASEKQHSETMDTTTEETTTGTTIVVSSSSKDTSNSVPVPQIITHGVVATQSEIQSPDPVSTTTMEEDVAVVQSTVQEPVTVATPIAISSITTQAPSQLIAQLPAGHTQSTTVPIVLRLPNGTTVPVAIPASVANPNVPVPTAISAVQTLMPTNIQQQQQQQQQVTTVHNSSSEAKMKLKAALTQGNMHVMSQAVEVVTRQQQEEEEEDLLMEQQHVHVEPQRTRRRRNTDDDPDQRRKKFLERNRAAAMRCRNKKKQWITSLEGKAEELNKTNQQLQNEVTTLRNEVAHLKQLLLAHKDCPITMLQQKSTQHHIVSGHSLQDKSVGGPTSTHQVTSVTAAEAVATSALTTMAQLATSEYQTAQSSVSAN
ncbi:cyclic AMP-dependent transcription factor ATF-2-like isoform X2 [Glandiceps talaboti]